jgi:hypothetical protein
LSKKAEKQSHIIANPVQWLSEGKCWIGVAQSGGEAAGSAISFILGIRQETAAPAAHFTAFHSIAFGERHCISFHSIAFGERHCISFRITPFHLS